MLEHVMVEGKLPPTNCGAEMELMLRLYCAARLLAPGARQLARMIIMDLYALCAGLGGDILLDPGEPVPRPRDCRVEIAGNQVLYMCEEGEYRVKCVMGGSVGGPSPLAGEASAVRNRSSQPG